MLPFCVKGAEEIDLRAKMRYNGRYGISALSEYSAYSLLEDGKMRKTKPFVFFMVVVLILCVAYTAIFGVTTWYGDIETVRIKGVEQIRWGIDIQGGVEATFVPADDFDATDEQLDAVMSVLKTRLVTQNITDSEVYVDYAKDRVIVRFPWATDEEDFDPEKAIKELGETAVLTFREGMEFDDAGLPTGVTAENILLTGSDVVSATIAMDNTTRMPVVRLEFTAEGKTKFANATGKLLGKVMSIWMDDTLISYPVVNAQITDGIAIIQSEYFTAESAKDLADKINSGSLPFKLEVDTLNTISATMGGNSLNAMVLAIVIAFALICVFMIVVYRLPGFVACFSLLGHLSLMLAAISGYFSTIPSFTLTLPGIAGIILSMGMAVDANVISAERIKEELRDGKSVDSALKNGYKNAFSAILDGNVTVIIVAFILMGTFGPSDSLATKLLSPLLSWLGVAVEGTIYSFGYTLFVGTILNLLMSVVVSRVMLYSISRIKALRKPCLYGGAK